MEMIELLTALYNAKEEETRAKNKRLEIERQLEIACAIPETWEGSTTNKVDNYKLKITRRMLVKIDAEKLIKTAKEKNFVPQLQTVFRWKPEIVKKEWDAAPDEIIRAFSPAIEKKPGKAAFDVEIVSDKNSTKKSNSIQEASLWLF